METATKYIKHTFTESEKRDLATELAQKISTKNELELKKKEVAAQIKADIDAADSQISQLSTHYNQGYMFKNVKCRVEFIPGEKIVEYWRLDNGELVETRKATQDELQMDIFGDGV